MTSLQRGRRNETIAEVSYEGGDSETSTSQLFYTNSRLSSNLPAPPLVTAVEWPLTEGIKNSLEWSVVPPPEATRDSLYSDQLCKSTTKHM